jgi:hypothetical protein
VACGGGIIAKGISNFELRNLGLRKCGIAKTRGSFNSLLAIPQSQLAIPQSQIPQSRNPAIPQSEIFMASLRRADHLPKNARGRRA